MSKPLAIPERQVTALARGAVKAGCIAEVTIDRRGDVIVRLVPKRDAPELDENPESALDAELAAFEAKHGHG